MATAWAPGLLAQNPSPIKRYLYAASPGIRDYLEHGGHGVLIFDIDNGHKFVKRLPMGGLNAAGNPENVKGIAASAKTKRLYVSTLNHLMSFDLVSGAMLWDRKYEFGCDRMEISPDGKILYQPSLEGNVWYVLDAISGNEIKRITLPGVKAHNTNFGRDGKSAYLAGLGSPNLSIAETVNHTVVRSVGPFGNVIRPFTHNGRQTLAYVNVNDLLGFEIGDLKTGKKLHRVEVTGYSKGAVARHGCPSHGIALTKDEVELWIVDGHNHFAHVFDNTVMPPRQKESIKLRDFPGWISFGIDGKLAYASTGDILDVKTKKIVATLTDETGRKFQSEKMLEIDFQGSEPILSGSQFGIGGATEPTGLVNRVRPSLAAAGYRPSMYLSWEGISPGNGASGGRSSLGFWNLTGNRVPIMERGPGVFLIRPMPAMK